MILVTGGTGLVGAHLLYKLVSNNEKVKAIYRSERKLIQTKDVFKTYTNNYNALFEFIDWIQADILDIPSLENAFKNVTHVYHCAAFVSFEPSKYRTLRKTNIEGTANVVNLCISNNIKKLCYVSSIATLGNYIQNDCVDETSLWNSGNDHSDYAITKYGAEMEVWRATQEGLPVVIVNPSVILGAGIWKYGTGSLFKTAKKGFKYYTSGTIGLVDVEDVVKVMITLMQSQITNERFVLVSENWTYKQFLESLTTSVNEKVPKKLASKWLLGIAWRLDWLKHKLTGKRRQLTKHLANTLSTENKYSSAKLKKALGYEFEPVAKTIAKVANFYLKQG